MNELIKVESKNGIDTVSARELHEFLGINKKFADWIKYNIDNYGFEIEKDFITILGKSTGGRPFKNYYITLDMAKELSMISRTDKGKEARQYFIECERTLKDSNTFSIEHIQSIVYTTITPILEQQNNFNRMLIDEVKELRNYTAPAQIEVPEKMTVREYCEKNDITDYNFPAFIKRVGRISTAMSRELKREISFKQEGSYNVGAYDIDILKHSVGAAKMPKQNTLFKGE